jgi:hypothetical protein
MVTHDVEVKAAGNSFEYDSPAKSMAAFIESVPEVTQSKTLMPMRRTERIAHGVQKIPDFLAVRFIEIPKLIDKIGIEMRFKASLRYCR